MRKFAFLISALALVACTKTPKIKAVKVTENSVESTVTTIGSGTVEAEQQADLTFGLVGRVAKVEAKAGDKVTQGQVLASLENADLSATARDASAEYKRSQDLFNSGLVSRVALDEARRQLKVAQTNFEKSMITAPFDGLVTDVNIRVGESVQTAATAAAGDPPVRLIDLKHRLVKGELDELDLGKVREGLRARIRIPALGREKVYWAKLTSVVPFISSTREQDRTSEIELRLEENDPRIPVGASAEIEIVTEQKPKALIVPPRTLLGTQEKKFVYKVVDGKLKKTDVQAGLGNYDRREIIKGLTAGDVVAFPAENFEISDGMKVEVELQPWP